MDLSVLSRVFWRILALVAALLSSNFAIAQYDNTIPPQVYGLSAGEYTFSVNGEKPGNFVLLQENVVPD